MSLMVFFGLRNIVGLPYDMLQLGALQSNTPGAAELLPVTRLCTTPL